MTNFDITLPVKRLTDTAILPGYAKAGDAGLDLHADESVVIKPGQRHAVCTGIAIALPQGYAGFVQPRSGLAMKHGISIVNTPGLIDSGYRGELKIILINTDTEEDFVINQGDRIAQLVIQQVPTVKIIEADELDETERGASGFGSSGI